MRISGHKLLFATASWSAQPKSITFAFILKSDSSKTCQTHKYKIVRLSWPNRCQMLQELTLFLPNLPFRGRWQPRPASEWPNSVTRRRRVDRRQNGGGPGFAGFQSGWKDPKEARLNPWAKAIDVIVAVRWNLADSRHGNTFNLFQFGDAKLHFSILFLCQNSSPSYLEQIYPDPLWL